MRSPLSRIAAFIGLALIFGLGQAKFIDTCSGLVTKQTPYCGSHGQVPNNPVTTGTWATKNPLHCRDICLNTEDPNACRAYRWDPIEGGYCIFYGQTLQQLGYQPNNISSSNVTWYNRDCYPKNCYRYCSYAPHPEPIWRPGQPIDNPSMEFPADQHDQYAPPLQARCQPNAYPYDGASFTRLVSGGKWITLGLTPGEFYRYRAATYYRLANLTLKSGDKKAQCHLTLGSTTKSFNSKTPAPMKIYQQISTTGEVNIDFASYLNLYASCTEGSYCAVDVDRFTIDAVADS